MSAITSDFANYYVPARTLARGGDVSHLYEREAFDEVERRAGLSMLGSFVPHPPANALLLWPLAHLAPRVAKVVWTLALAAAYAGAFVAASRALAVDHTLLALVWLLPSAALANALAYGQPYPLLLLLMCASLWAMQRGRTGLAGALLAPVAILKLYALPFLAVFVLRRQWRAAAAFVATALALLAVSVAALGADLHRAYAREVLPASLEGRIQDPYSTIWQSPSSLARRLFEREVDLNPDPLVDRPVLARALARGLPAGILALAVGAASVTPSAAVQWGILTAGALAASPLAASYHFVLLPFAVAAGLSARAPRPAARALVLALLAFATSPLPHHFSVFAHGAGNVLAYPRLAAMVALLAWSARGHLTWRRVGLAVLVGVAAGAMVRVPPRDPRWERLAPVAGYLQARPIACGGRYAWLGIENGAYVVATSDGQRRPVLEAPQVPACEGGDVVLRPPTGDGPRSPDGAWRLLHTWRGGSWDVVAVSTIDGREVPVAAAPGSHESEPSWSEDGGYVLFASDAGRGLGSTAAYRVPAGLPRVAGR
jgi:hypothetical protein